MVRDDFLIRRGGSMSCPQAFLVFTLDNNSSICVAFVSLKLKQSSLPFMPLFA